MVRCAWILMILYLISSQLYAQKCQQVHLHGQVIDSTNFTDYRKCIFKNHSANSGIHIKENGNFRGIAKEGDLLSLACRDCESISFYVTNQDGNCNMDTILTIINQKVQEFEDVSVYPSYSLQAIGAQRKVLALETAPKMGTLESIQSPITAIYNRYSKQAKTKEKIRDLQFAFQKEKILTQYVHTYLSHQFLKIPAHLVDAFIAFIDVDLEFLRTSNEYSLMLEIQKQSLVFLKLYQTDKP
ncbi:MAG: hypothetical protein JJT77_01515 [Crocinitomicaceae bacterium]|nr:hypothetical protein [Crocinitomicaceae bacterium]